jgi:transcription elongation factor Elf1
MCASCLTMNIREKWTQPIRELVEELKTEFGCVDCGYKEHPIALDFDHLADKKYPISQMVRGKSGKLSFDEMLDELAKCEIRCANCHRIETQRRRDYKE